MGGESECMYKYFEPFVRNVSYVLNMNQIHGTKNVGTNAYNRTQPQLLSFYFIQLGVECVLFNEFYGNKSEAKGKINNFCVANV